MKRGLITWDKTEIPPSVFEARLRVVRDELARRDLPALAIYSDVWRSNQGRYLSNFMPYWNRALLVIPRDGAPMLLSGLSPRVYPWIRSVTIIEEIRPSQNISQVLAKLREEKRWQKIGALDSGLFPFDLRIPDSVDVPWSAIHPQPDEAELGMYRRAARLARSVLDREMAAGSGLTDHEFVSRLELAYRRAGAEDLVILTAHNGSPPLAPGGAVIGPSSSVSVSVEYRGHWAQVIRSSGAAGDGSVAQKRILSGPYPWEYVTDAEILPGSIFSTTVEHRDKKQPATDRVFTGDTYWQGLAGPELL
jgi:hypothetical protein